ncbi:MAG: hypothetical protein IIU63_01750, partial [Clostridia bacterium]|nr:hypothetical protein [Clostridia bacterium]
MNGRRLYEEIGGVDERYLQQAAAYRARRSAPAWRALLIAAALTLVGALLLCTIAASVTIGVLVGILGDGEEPTPPAPMEQMELAMQEAQQKRTPYSADEVEPMLFYQPMLIFSLCCGLRRQIGCRDADVDGTVIVILQFRTQCCRFHIGFLRYHNQHRCLGSKLIHSHAHCGFRNSPGKFAGADCQPVRLPI